MAAPSPPYESIQAYCDAHIQAHDESAEAKAVASCNAGITPISYHHIMLYKHWILASFI